MNAMPLERFDRLIGAVQRNCHIADARHARDLTTMPAALQGGTVIVRREALRQWLWEKAEAWALKRTPETETVMLILHERGEHAAGRRLGSAWEERLARSAERRAEILMRAVRDNLANFDAAKVGAGGTAQALQEISRRGAEHFEQVARRLLGLDEAAVKALSHDTPALALA